MHKKIGKFEIEANDRQLFITYHKNPTEFFSPRKSMRYFSNNPNHIKETYKSLQNINQVKTFVTDNFVVNPKFKNIENIDKWNIDNQDLYFPSIEIDPEILKDMFDKRKGSDIQKWLCDDNNKTCHQEIKLLLYKHDPKVKKLIHQIAQEPDEIKNAIKLAVAKQKDSVMIEKVDFNIALDPDLFGIRVRYRPNIKQKDLFSFSEK